MSPHFGFPVDLCLFISMTADCVRNCDYLCSLWSQQRFFVCVCGGGKAGWDVTERVRMKGSSGHGNLLSCSPICSGAGGDRDAECVRDEVRKKKRKHKDQKCEYEYQRTGTCTFEWLDRRNPPGQIQGCVLSPVPQMAESGLPEVCA